MSYLSKKKTTRKKIIRYSNWAIFLLINSVEDVSKCQRENRSKIFSLKKRRNPHIQKWTNDSFKFNLLHLKLNVSSFCGISECLDACKDRFKIFYKEKTMLMNYEESTRIFGSLRFLKKEQKNVKIRLLKKIFTNFIKMT